MISPFVIPAKAGIHFLLPAAAMQVDPGLAGVTELCDG